MGFKPSQKKPLTSLSLIILSPSLLLVLLSVYHFHSQNAVPIKPYRRSVEHLPWYQVMANELGQRRVRMGLVNINSEAVESLVGLMHGEAAEMVEVDFSPVGDRVRWEDLFPEWINEDVPEEQKCPEIPMPRFEDYGDFDVVVAGVPCLGSRDVFRLQVNLVVAQLLVRGGGWEEEYYHEDKMKYAVFMGSCGPMWEIFRCDDLLWNDGVWSIYKPSLRKLQQKLIMPVGSCQLSTLVAEPGHEGWGRDALNTTLLHLQAREAYVTILHSSEAYVCGAIALAQSIIQSKSTKDLVLLADDHMSKESLQGLRAAGWKIKRIQRIRNPRAMKDAYNEWNYSKLRLWELTEYDKVIFIDSDLIVLRNMDEFFVCPQISAAGNDGHIFNSGVMMVEPSKCAFRTLMHKRYAVASYNGGDQGFLNEVFTWWHRWPRRLNVLKVFSSAKDEFSKRAKVPKNSYAMHYLGIKPWMCYRDYDCNWDMPKNQKYACDWAHQKWWEVYDGMPEDLRPFCALTPRMDARTREWREGARNASLPDGHWKIEVKDPRMHSYLQVNYTMSFGVSFG